MPSLLLLLLVAMLFGFVVAQALTPVCLRLTVRRVARISYGGVWRIIPDHGGLILALSTAIALLPLVAVKLVSGSLPIATMALCFFRRPRRIVLLLILALLFLSVPNRDLLALAVIMGLGAVLRVQAAAADQVPGIFVALHAAPLAGASAVLLMEFDHIEALVGSVVAGALLAVHRWHRFPPRLAFGAIGMNLLVPLNVAIMGALMIEGDTLALIMGWSFPIIDAICRMLRPFARAPFENARLRGEPETGLALATGALSSASVIAMLAVRNNHGAVQIGAAIISIMMAWQFRRFLMRSQQVHPARAPWHRQEGTSR